MISFHGGFDLPCELLILWFTFSFIPSSTLFKKRFYENALKNIFQIFFQTKSDIVQIFPMIFNWPSFANICCPLFFSKEADLKNACCFFILGLMLLWFRVQQNRPGEKSVGDFQSWEPNRGQQWLSRTAQIIICQGFRWGRNFDWFCREKIRPFWTLFGSLL